MNKKKPIKTIRWLFSYTLCWSDYYKAQARSIRERGERVIRLNKSYFMISLINTIIGVIINDRVPYDGLKGLLLIGLPIYALSRCNEVFMAFVRDVFDKLDKSKRDKNGLEYFERIQLALRSYVELIMHYALLYYLIDTNALFYHLGEQGFERPLEHFFDAIYFSVITIVSVGYGDICPIHPITQALVIYEVISGMLLLVVSFTVYVNLTLDE